MDRSGGWDVRGQAGSGPRSFPGVAQTPPQSPVQLVQRLAERDAGGETADIDADGVDDYLDLAAPAGHADAADGAPAAAPTVASGRRSRPSRTRAVDQR